MSMIKPKLTLFQMKIEGMFLHSPETNQASFGICPKAFNAVYVALLIGEFILAVLHSVVFLITKVYQAVVPAPSVRVNNTFRVYAATDNALQGGSGAIRDDFSVNPALSFKKAKNNSFASGSSPSQSTNTKSAKVAFINLNLARNRRFSLTGKGYPFAYSLE